MNIKIAETIRNSLTYEEKEDFSIINDSRLKRISKGSGLSVKTVKLYLPDIEYIDYIDYTDKKNIQHECSSWGHSHCKKCRGLIFSDSIRDNNVMVNKKAIIIAHKECPEK